jgi:hypothetical protein
MLPAPSSSFRKDDNPAIKTSPLARGAIYYAYRFIKGTGLVTVCHSSIDVKLILIQRFVRVFALGLVSLLLAVYLAALGNSKTYRDRPNTSMNVPKVEIHCSVRART